VNRPRLFFFRKSSAKVPQEFRRPPDWRTPKVPLFILFKPFETNNDGSMKVMHEAEAETKRQKAIEFLERIGGDAEKFREMDAAAYAESKGAELLNPSKRKTSMTKKELDSLVDEIADGLDEALDPSLTREELVDKVKELANLASGEEPETDDEDLDNDE
jgi:hypothetical protein